jgi:hypothetical protein
VHRYWARETRYTHFRQTDAPLLADGRLHVALQQLLLPLHQRLRQDRVALDGGPHRQLLRPSGGAVGAHTRSAEATNESNSAWHYSSFCFRRISDFTKTAWHWMVDCTGSRWGLVVGAVGARLDP